MRMEEVPRHPFSHGHPGTAALGQAREEAQGREMATAAWFATQHVLSWSTWSSSLGSSLYPLRLIRLPTTTAFSKASHCST